MLRFFVRILLLAVIVGALQASVVPSLRREAKEVNEVLCEVSDCTDVLYFCDSTNRWVDDSDTDVRSISEMTQAAFPTLTISAADRNSFHAGVYESLVTLLADRNQLPKVLVVPVNLRSFSPAWDRRPECQFDDLQDHIRYADRKWRLGLIAVSKMFPASNDNATSDDAYNSLPVYRGSQCIGCVADFENESYEVPTPARTRNKFVYHYMYPLEADHRRLHSLVRLAQIAREHGSQAVFYITPVDVSSGIRLVGEEFQSQVERNIRVIRSQLEAHGPMLDLAFDLPSDAFAWHLYPNEHLNQDGRRYVASALEASIAERMNMRRVPGQAAGPRYAAHRDRASRSHAGGGRAIR